MTEQRFLVTGALGCIGAWTVKQLLGEGAPSGLPVWTYDLPGSRHRLHLILDDDALARVNFIAGDITDENAFAAAVNDNAITHIVHLAALQVPFVRADPIRGMRVNAVGTTIVFETVRRSEGRVQGFAYASSVGVYGPPSRYPPGPLAHDAPHDPPHLYGVTKQANEGTARIYWQEYGIHSIGLRPYIIYGPGRDQGMTSTPTKAMLAAAAARPYRINFGGTLVYHHAADAAAVFVKAARTQLPNAPVYNLGGNTASMAEIVQGIDAAAPDMAGKITFDPNPMVGPESIDDRALNAALGPIAWRPLAQGIGETVEHFRRAIQHGKVDVDRILA